MTMTLRNVPDSVHELLKTRARQNRRSVNQEAIAVFEGVLAPKPTTRAEEVARILNEIDEDRALMPQLLSAREIDEAIEEGRR